MADVNWTKYNCDLCRAVGFVLAGVAAGFLIWLLTKTGMPVWVLAILFILAWGILFTIVDRYCQGRAEGYRQAAVGTTASVASYQAAGDGASSDAAAADAAAKAAADKAAADAAAAEAAQREADAQVAAETAAAGEAAAKTAAEAAEREAAEKAAADAAAQEAADKSAADEAAAKQAAANEAAEREAAAKAEAEAAEREAAEKAAAAQAASAAASADDARSAEIARATAAGEADRDGDGTVEGIYEGTRPAALDGPRDGLADDLKRVKGIGPKLEKLCHTLGFYHFDQIAAWSADEVAWVDSNLEGFKGRVTRDEWVRQATVLAGGGETDFSKRVDDGDVPSSQ